MIDAQKKRPVVVSIVQTRKSRNTRKVQICRETFNEYSERWFDEAKADGLRSIKQYESLLRILRAEFGDALMVEINRQWYRDWLSRTRRSTTRLGKPIAPRTVVSRSRLLATIFRAAVDDEIIERTPIKPGRRDMPKVRDADPEWRPNAIFTRAEVISLLTDKRIPLKHRVTFALEFFLGVRAGELSALRFADFVAEEGVPLHMVKIVSAWNTNAKKLQSPKNHNARVHAAHPGLWSIISEWQAEGWRLEVGRHPLPEDKVIPVYDARRGLRPLRNNLAYKWITNACDTIGIRRRGSHIARATFTSLIQEDGAKPVVVERLSHGAPTGEGGGRVLAGYTRFSRLALCEAVMCLQLDLTQV